MGRSPCCEKAHTTKGAWTKEEDARLTAYIRAHGEGCWPALPRAAGLLRCGKSCRLRWINYLRPDLKRGNFSAGEEEAIVALHARLGNRWSRIAARLPGRTDNEVKNHWNTHLRRRLLASGIDPVTHRPVGSESHHRRPQEEAQAPVAAVVDTGKPPPQRQQRSRCPDLNLDLCISPPSPFQQDQRRDEGGREAGAAGPSSSALFRRVQPPGAGREQERGLQLLRRRQLPGPQSPRLEMK